MTETRLSPSTLAVHAGEAPDPTTGALEPPLVLSSAFAFDDAEDAAARFSGEREGLIYSRWKNPTVAAFEQKMAALEGAEAAVGLASGMAAVVGAITTLAGQGDHVVAPTSVYAETARALREHLARFGIETTFVDLASADAGETLARALRERTEVVWVETPANPTVAITDIGAVSETARAVGARVVVDNTFATPYHQSPLELGADLVVHSATKGICGHGDAIGGVVAGPSEVVERVRAEMARMAGAVMSPFVAWLLSRGARTLALRADRASRTALELANRLEASPRVARVYYPGLPSHPGHALATRQMKRGFGALVAFEVAGNSGDAVRAGRGVYDAVRIVSRAVSLGDARTLLTHAASTTHASMPRDARQRGGITDGLMRLSVGIEDVEDLWADLERALEHPR